MKKISKKQGFTLMELLLVIAVLAIVVAVVAPNFMEAYTSMHDGTAEQMVTSLLANTRSLAISGQTNKSTITFKTDGTIMIGESIYSLPSGFSFGITTEKSYKFDIKGNVTPSGESITVKRNGYSKKIEIK